MIADGVVASCRSPRWRQRRRKSTSGFSFGDVSHLRTSKSIRIPNFASMAQSAAEILLLPVSKNKRPPYWNSTSGSHFDIVISMWFCIGVQNFIQIGASAAELWCHSDFQDGGRQPCWICCVVMVDHARSVVVGCFYVLKFCLDQIYSFGDGAIFRFLHFDLNLRIHAHF